MFNRRNLPDRNPTATEKPAEISNYFIFVTEATMTYNDH